MVELSDWLIKKYGGSVEILIRTLILAQPALKYRFKINQVFSTEQWKIKEQPNLTEA